MLPFDYFRRLSSMVATEQNLQLSQLHPCNLYMLTPAMIRIWWVSYIAKVDRVHE